MDDAILDFRLGKYSPYRRRESRQIIRAGDENVLHTSVFQPVEYSFPVLGTFVFSYPHPQHVFSTVQIDTQGDINCLFHDLSFAADVIVDGVQKDHSVDCLQGTLLPFLGNGKNLICDPADGGI